MSNPAPIGIFDSGLGGLTVVKELYRLMPSERVVYLGDTCRFPYGGRSDKSIISFARQNAGFLRGKGIKMLVVACNTASSVALETLRKEITDVPVIGVVLPGAKSAVVRTANRKVGVIGTRATINSGAYARAIAHIDRSVKVYPKPCPLFAPLVEEGFIDNEIAQLTVEHYLYELIDTGIDCLILGCTHYPLLKEIIQGTVGSGIELIDSALWTAKEMQDILTSLQETSDAEEDGYRNSTFYVTDKTPNYEETAADFLGKALPNVYSLTLQQLCASDDT